MIKDPPVREDGLCYVCLEARQPERSKKYAPGIADADPFCSVECARAYHGQPELAAEGHDRRVEGARGQRRWKAA